MRGAQSNLPNQGSLEFFSRSKFRTRLVLTGFAVSVGLLGLIPHLVFSFHVNEVSYFKYAYDEEFYSTLALDRAVAPGRVLSGALFQLLYILSGSNLERALLLSDFVFPFICAWAALYASLSFSRQVSEILIVATLLIFGPELLPLGSAAPLGKALGDWGTVLWPHFYTGYFSIFRTPEPQVSWSVLLAFLGFSYRVLILKETALPTKDKVSFVLLCLLASLGYGVCFFAILLLMVFLLFRSLLLAPPSHIPLLLAGLAVAGAAFLLPMTNVLSSDLGSGSAFGFFDSRLPSIGMSTFISFFLLYLSWGLVRRLGWKSLRVHFLAACMFLPVIVMNQQIVSGIMISTAHWERYTNYQFLVFGAGIWGSLYGILGSDSERLKKMQPLRLLVLGFLLYIVMARQAQTYRNWFYTNEISVAQKHAVEDAAKQGIIEVRQVVVEDAIGAALLSARLPQGIDVLANYNSLFTERIADMQGDQATAPAGRLPHLKRLFHYLARTGKTPEWLFNTLRGEAEARAGFYLGFFFSFRDYWGPFSDYRCVRSDEIRAQIPELVDSYRKYLQEPQEEWKTPAVYLSARPVQRGETRYWQYTLIGKGQSGKANGRIVWAYLQSPKPLAEQPR